MKLLTCFVANLSIEVLGHAYVHWPPSRASLQSGSGGAWNYNKKGTVIQTSDSSAAGGGGSPYAGSLCGSASMVSTPTAAADLPVYQSGGEMPVVINFHAQHGGRLDFRVCRRAITAADTAAAECLDQEPLLHRQCVPECGCKSDRCRRQASPDEAIFQNRGDVLNPGMALQQGASEITIQIPASLECDYCTVQWHWQTAWGEEFWNCFDVAIKKGPVPSPPGYAPTPAGAGPVPVGPPSPSSPTSPSSPSPPPPINTDCAHDYGDCKSSRCCQSSGFTCFKKDDYFSGCQKECPEGGDWDCTVLSGPRPVPSPMPSPSPSVPHPAPDHKFEYWTSNGATATFTLQNKKAGRVCVDGKVSEATTVYYQSKGDIYHSWSSNDPCCMSAAPEYGGKPQGPMNIWAIETSGGFGFCECLGWTPENGGTTCAGQATPASMKCPVLGGTKNMCADTGALASRPASLGGPVGPGGAEPEPETEEPEPEPEPEPETEKPTPEPEQEPEPESEQKDCEYWCDLPPVAWTRKCTWWNCATCTQCAAAPEPEPEPEAKTYEAKTSCPAGTVVNNEADCGAAADALGFKFKKVKNIKMPTGCSVHTKNKQARFNDATGVAHKKWKRLMCANVALLQQVDQVQRRLSRELTVTELEALRDRNIAHFVSRRDMRMKAQKARMTGRTKFSQHVTLEVTPSGDILDA